MSTSGSFDKTPTAGGSWMPPDDTDEKMLHGYKIITEAHRGKVTALETEIRMLRASLEESRQQTMNAQKRAAQFEAAFNETHVKLQSSVKDNELLSQQLKLLSKQNDRFRRLQQTFSEAIEQSIHPAEDEMPLYSNAVHYDLGSAAPTSSRPTSMPTVPTPTQNFVMPSMSSVAPPSHMSPKTCHSASLLPPATQNSSATSLVAQPAVVAHVSHPAVAQPAPAAHPTSSFDSNGKDAKAFFRSVRSRLSYEGFNQFLAAIKRLNNHQDTKEATIDQIRKIFGEQNADMVAEFTTMIHKHHAST